MKNLGKWGIIRFWYLKKNCKTQGGLMAKQKSGDFRPSRNIVLHSYIYPGQKAVGSKLQTTGNHVVCHWVVENRKVELKEEV